MSKHKIALIGAGSRANSYCQPLVASNKAEIVAIADPEPMHRKATAQKSAIPAGFAEYADWRDLLKEHSDLDGVIISSPNNVHIGPAVACLEAGLPVACEKPLASTKGDCERIIDAERANNGRTLIGFVLRSTPFYSKAWHLISEEGVIGRIVSLQCDELPGWGVSSIINRSPWRRFEEISGGVMLEKSCHDMDIVNWLMGCRPTAIHSFGSRQVFCPNSALPARCEDCKVADDCHYYKKPRLSSQEDHAEDQMHEYIREAGNQCVYNVNKTGVDVQSVAMEYENGAVANFMLNLNCAGPQSGRNLHAIGTHGRVWGNFHENKIWSYDNRSGETQEYDTSGDGSGHGGGDRIHALRLIEMIENPDYRPAQNAQAGYLSAVACFAADMSRREGRRVHLTYEDNTRIQLT